jgi:hypothetical protein
MQLVLVSHHPCCCLRRRARPAHGGASSTGGPAGGSSSALTPVEGAVDLARSALKELEDLADDPNHGVARGWCLLLLSDLVNDDTEALEAAKEARDVFAEVRPL